MPPLKSIDGKVVESFLYYEIPTMLWSMLSMHLFRPVAKGRQYEQGARDMETSGGAFEGH
ncbi:uncharacterized protein J3R85_014839 [Psidium guajava]|nr:uncharacterized protein J3R85_014839 [Psidium guajava]